MPVFEPNPWAPQSASKAVQLRMYPANKANIVTDAMKQQTQEPGGVAGPPQVEDAAVLARHLLAAAAGDAPWDRATLGASLAAYNVDRRARVGRCTVATYFTELLSQHPKVRPCTVALLLIIIRSVPRKSVDAIQGRCCSVRCAH